MLAVLREIGVTLDFQPKKDYFYASTPEAEYCIDYNSHLKTARLFRKRLTDKRFKAILTLND